MHTIKKTSCYYVIVHKINRKMLLQDCKAPIYWNKKVAQKICDLFSDFEVKKIPAKDFNNLIELTIL